MPKRVWASNPKHRQRCHRFCVYQAGESRSFKQVPTEASSSPQDTNNTNTKNENLGVMPKPTASTPATATGASADGTADSKEKKVEGGAGIRPRKTSRDLAAAASLAEFPYHYDSLSIFRNKDPQLKAVVPDLEVRLSRFLLVGEGVTMVIHLSSLSNQAQNALVHHATCGNREVPCRIRTGCLWPVSQFVVLPLEQDVACGKSCLSRRSILRRRPNLPNQRKGRHVRTTHLARQS